MFFRKDGNKLYLNCSIQPKAKEDRVVGTVGEHLKIRITAAPTDGKANKHLVKFLSRQFQVKQSAVTIVFGHSSRLKTVCIDEPAVLPDFMVSARDSETG